MLENLRWEHPRRQHDFHSSWEGAPNLWRSRRDAQRSALTVELSAPPAGVQPAMLLGELILSMLPLAMGPAPPPGTGLLQAVLDDQKLEDTSREACRGAWI